MVPIEPPVIITDDPIQKLPAENDAVLVKEETSIYIDSSSQENEAISEKAPSVSLFNMMDSSSAVEEASKEIKKDREEVSFSDTNELIDHQIQAIDAFIAGLDATDRTTLAEEAEYELQKEHFTELEIQADVKHKKNLVERAHAEEMKVYLKKQKTQEPEENKSDDVKQDVAQDISNDEEASVKPTKKKEWNWFSKKDDENKKEQPKEIFL